MSWLIFKRSAGRVLLIEGSYSAQKGAYKVKASWPAHNEAASTSAGPWPNGVFKYSTYNEHTEMGLQPGCYRTAYGCFGIHIFDVTGRSGMGIHAGRTFGQPDLPGGKTLGCIRVPNNAMEVINSVHNTDRLELVLVTD